MWRQIVERLEDVEDRELLVKLAPTLAAGPTDALRWDDVESDWT